VKRKLIAGVVVIGLFTALSTYVLKIPPWRLGAAVEVATGLGAKLACSGYFISGFDKARLVDDLATYSPATRLLDLQINDADKTVTASLLGMGKTRAEFRPRLGCTLALGDTSEIAEFAGTGQFGINTSAAAVKWPKGNDVDTIDTDFQLRTDDLLQRDNAAGLDTRALLMVKGGQVVAESYAEGYSESTRFLGWSMGKSITAMQIGNLILNGKLTTDERNLFPSLWTDARAEVTVEHLLTMTSGMTFDETYIPGSDSTKMLFGAHSASDVALTSEYGHLPGTHFSYSSGTTNILSRLLFERVGGTVDANYRYFNEQFLQPLALTSLVFETDGSGVFVGSSYPYATARDWGKLGLLLLNKGELNGFRVFSEAFATALSVPNNSENERSYGYQVWLNDGDDALRWPALPSDAYAMRGNRSQIVMVIPSMDMVIVRLGWTSGWYSANERFAELIY